jgi:hypothetical protein
MLLYFTQQTILKLWGFWSGIFAPLPYNDQVAFGALIVLVAVSAKLIFGRETRE